MTILRAAVVFALLALLGRQADAAAAGVVSLTLPRPAAANEDVVLRVRAGILSRGMEVDVYDAQGVLLGTVSPFAIRGGHEAGTYTIPLRGELEHARTIAVRLVLTQFGVPPRPPTAREVRGVTLAFVGVTR